MAASARFSGVFAPVIMPFGPDLSVDADRLARQCRWLLSQGVGLAVFGTNSEANSLSVGEKSDLLQRLIEAGIDPERMMPGTGACAIPDAVELTRQAVRRGCGGVLMLPPFYYKGVSDEGLFRYYAEVIERVGSRELRIYLYHIPPVAQVGLSIELIGRLVHAYPQVIAGIKDSSGDWDNTAALLNENWDNFRVFAGSETFLLRTLRAGGAGCISATANINPAAIDRLYREWQSDSADAQQQSLNDLRDLLQMHPMIAALKSVVAHFTDDPQWTEVRPPLMPLAGDKRSLLLDELFNLGFEMAGLAE
ncbi:MAG: dihydrodipicolinate synthase family protein [Woeseia sp.]